MSVMTLRIPGHLGLASVAERDRLPHYRRLEGRDRRRGVLDHHRARRWDAGTRDDREDRNEPRHRLHHEAAARILATVRSRPSSWSDSGSGGDTFEPVT